MKVARVLIVLVLLIVPSVARSLWFTREDICGLHLYPPQIMPA
jgi:hypothetical protein